MTLPVRLEILGPTDGAFIIGKSVVGDNISAAGATLDWVEYLPKATGLHITRGGDTGGVAPSPDVGTLSVTLTDRQAIDGLAEDLNLRPNNALRVVAPVEAVPVVESWNTASAAVPLFTDIPAPTFATNAISSLGIGASGGLVHPAPSSTGTYTAKNAASIGASTLLATHAPDNGPETYRVQVLLRANGTGCRFQWCRESGTAMTTISQSDPQLTWVSIPAGTTKVFTVEFEPAALSGGLPYLCVGLDTTVNGSFIEVLGWDRTATDNDASNIFTGVIGDLDISHAKDGTAYVTLTGVDAVASLSNTPRTGAISGPPNYEDFPTRINRLMQSARVPWEGPGSAYPVKSLSNPLNAWSYYGTSTRPVGTPIHANYSSLLGVLVDFKAGSPALNSGTYGVVRTITGLEIGASYEVQVYMQMGWSRADLNQFPQLQVPFSAFISGMGGVQTKVPEPRDETAIPLRVRFTATATTHQLRLSRVGNLPTNEGFAFVFHTVLEQTGGLVKYRLRDNAYQSADLRSHLNVACSSVDAAWWVARDGVVRFSTQTPTSTIMSLSDTASGDVSYTDIATNYATQTVVSALDINNLGRDAVSGNSADERVAIIDDHLAGQWGERSQSVDWNLWTGAGYETSVETRAAEVFAALGTPSRAPVSVTYSAHDALEQTAHMDLYDVVAVTHRGTTWRCRIVGIDHDIRVSGTWLITLKLRAII